LPEASDGDGYNDPDNNDYVVIVYDEEGRGNSACEAVEHCQKFQSNGKVFEMQVLVSIKDIYDCICRCGIVEIGFVRGILLFRSFSLRGRI
jgi:hypothetical protein